ncbi:MAG: T9SS type A sorting domain-containing protein, partial [Phaeodactylibacter sp.]|nr:T9SS type A sorting domain-containing protein [Phaeodactylibacter sp.]
SLMTPFIPDGAVEHEPGPVTLGILQDIGWTLSPTALVKLPGTSDLFRLAPNPVLNEANLDLEVQESGWYNCRVFDLSGRLLLNEALGYLPTGPHTERLNLSEIPEGLYLLQVEGPGTLHTQRLIRMNP